MRQRETASGGDLAGYFLPTNLAVRTNVALALIRFPSLRVYQTCREGLMRDPDTVAKAPYAQAAGCILVEDRSFLQQVPEQSREGCR